jgi:hypothetical protein
MEGFRSKADLDAVSAALLQLAQPAKAGNGWLKIRNVCLAISVR